MQMTFAALIKIQEKVLTERERERGGGRDWKWIYRSVIQIRRHNLQHCEDDLVYRPAHLREYNIKLSSAMQHGGFIKSFSSRATPATGSTRMIDDLRWQSSFLFLFHVHIIAEQASSLKSYLGKKKKR